MKRKKVGWEGGGGVGEWKLEEEMNGKGKNIER